MLPGENVRRPSGKHFTTMGTHWGFAGGIKQETILGGGRRGGIGLMVFRGFQISARFLMGRGSSFKSPELGTSQIGFARKVARKLQSAAAQIIFRKFHAKPTPVTRSTKLRAHESRGFRG